jgi:hypothetical protein
MECEDVRQRLKAFIDDDLGDAERTAVRDHLEACRDCSKAARQLEKLPGVLQAWKGEDLPRDLYDRLKARLDSRDPWWRKLLTPAFLGKTALRLAEAAGIVLITLLVSDQLRKPKPAQPEDDFATIHFYVTEHQEAVLQAASVETPDRQPARVIVNRDDVMYYEYIDDHRRISRPGVILRGPEGRAGAEAAAASDPEIAGSKALTPDQARAAVGFNPVAPARIHPGYILDTITKVGGRESLHLLYTNGIDTISVFEQPLGASQGLAAEDFRRYAVYKSATPAEGLGSQAGMTILAWKNSHVSFVLIGRADMSRLMDIAQAFTGAGRSRSESGERP